MPVVSYLALALLGSNVLGMIVYAILSKWWRSVVGWSIMLLFFALAAVSGVVWARVTYDEFPGRDELLLVTFGFLIIIVLGVTANIIREQVRWDREHP